MADRRGSHAEFETFIPIGTKEGKAAETAAVNVISKHYSRGIETCRDAWAYNFNRNSLTENMSEMIDTYNEQVFKWEQRSNRDARVDDFVIYDDKKISWSSSLKQKLKGGQFAEFEDTKIRQSLYRPFTKSNLYFDRVMNHRVGMFPSFFPTP